MQNDFSNITRPSGHSAVTLPPCPPMPFPPPSMSNSSSNFNYLGPCVGYGQQGPPQLFSQPGPPGAFQQQGSSSNTFHQGPNNTSGNQQYHQDQGAMGFIPQPGMNFGDMYNQTRFVPPPFHWGHFPPHPPPFRPPHFQQPPQNNYTQPAIPQDGHLPANVRSKNWSANSGMPTLKTFPTKPTPPTETQEQTDGIWITNFLKNCEYNRTRSLKNEENLNVLKISQAKQLHKQAYKIIKDMEEINSISKTNSVEKLRVELKEKVNILKKELDQILAKLSDEKVLNHLSQSIEKRKKKRMQDRERRRNAYLEKQKTRTIIEEKHRQLDEWILKRQDLEEKQKREKEVQKQLDHCLQDVHQKQNQLRKSLELFISFAKLRKIRRESASRRGQELPSVNDDNFETAYSCSRDILESKLQTCKEEEQALRQFLAEEQRVHEENKKRKKMKEEEEKRKQWNSDRWEVLFGPVVELDAFNPMWPMQEMHKQASSSLVALVNTRQQWDRYMVTEGGSRIPSCWVEPSQPSSAKWEKYCVKEESDES